MDKLELYSNLFVDFLKSNQFQRNPQTLYEPVQYILDLGGKRLRPVLVLMGHEVIEPNYQNALNAACAVEIFHNFTLIHDDIMDNAFTRRGKSTVHQTYGINRAILSGDVMMIQAFQYLLKYEDSLKSKQLLDVFSKMAIEVCEGQQMDIDFETMVPSIEKYLFMIELKTSVLIGAALQMGAIVAGATVEDQKHLYAFGVNFGIAFQIQDDILDTFGEEKMFGKRIGGDIIQNKKTYLYLKSLELASENERKSLLGFYNPDFDGDESTKIRSVTKIFQDLNVREYAHQVIEAYRDLAMSHLRACSKSDQDKATLLSFLNKMIYRNS